MEIRKLNNNLKDIEELLEINEKSFGNYRNIDDIREVLKYPEYNIIVACMENKIVGFVALMQVRTLQYNGLWIDLLAVLPEKRRMGIAKELIKEAVEMSKNLDVDFLSALVRNDNTGSLKTIEKFGFHHEGNEYKLLIK